MSSTPPPRDPLDSSQLLLPARLRPLLSRLALSLLVAGCFVWLLRRGGLPVVPASSAFESLSWWALPGYLLIYGVSTVLRTYRWIYLLRPIQPRLSAQRVFAIGLVGFMAILFAPLRAGEVVRPWLLARDGQTSFLQATGTVAAERIVDGLALTLILAFGLLRAAPLSPLPDRLGQLPLPVAVIPRAASGALLAFAAAFVAMAAFYFFRVAAQRALYALVGRISRRLADWLSERFEHLADGLQFLVSRHHATPFLRDTLLYWTTSALSVWWLLRGCGLPASFVQGCVIMGIMGIGSLIPSGPGFFGAYQLSAYCGLAMFFPGPSVLEAGAVFTFVSYAMQLVLTALLGVLGLRWMARTAVLSGVPVTRNTNATT